MEASASGEPVRRIVPVITSHRCVQRRWIPEQERGKYVSTHTPVRNEITRKYAHLKYLKIEISMSLIQLLTHILETYRIW
jgi:hypothetical protein